METRFGSEEVANFSFYSTYLQNETEYRSWGGDTKSKLSELGFEQRNCTNHNQSDGLEVMDMVNTIF